MRRSTCLTDCALALFCVLLWVPIASGQQTSATGTPQPVAGPTIVVKMIDTVDSSRDRAGKQYRAGLIRPVNAGNGVIIGQGSVATLTLARNASGWGVQLSSVVINGQVVPVTSNSGSVVGAAAQKDTANAATAASAVLGQFGRKPNTFPAFAAVATGERVNLTPGVTLSFVLNAIPLVSDASSPPAPAPVLVAKQSVAGQNVPAQARIQPGTIYLCWISTNTQPSVVYRSGVFHVAASTSLRAINEGFQNYLRKNYHLQFSGSVCGDLFNGPDGERYIQWLEQGAKTHKSEVVVVDWKYVPDQDVRPPAESPSGLALGYCSSNSVKPPIYVSDIFGTNIPVQGGDTLDIGNDYYQYLKQKYAYKSTSNYPVGCPIFRSRSSAEASKQKLETQWKQTNQEVIETGWKWVIPPGTPVQRRLNP